MDRDERREEVKAGAEQGVGAHHGVQQAAVISKKPRAITAAKGQTTEAEAAEELFSTTWSFWAAAWA